MGSDNDDKVKTPTPWQMLGDWGRENLTRTISNVEKVEKLNFDRLNGKTRSS